MFTWININYVNSQISKPQPKPQKPSPPKRSPQILPNLLAGRILDLQFQSQTEAFSRDLIASLTCLYIQAVEYYQARNSDKYKIYHKRMEAFFKRKTVDQILRGKSGELVNKKQNTQKSINQARNKSKSQVTKIMNQTEKRVTKQKIILNNDIQDQNKRLNARIHRRKTMSNRSIYSEKDETDIDNQQKYSGIKCLDLGDMDLGEMIVTLNSGRQSRAKKVFI